MKIPNDILENKKFRVKILEEADKDLKLREIIKQKCKINKEFFFNVFLWTLDPRKPSSHLPYLLYPKQVKLLEELDICLALSKKGENVNLVLDKPRDVGATFTVMGWIFHKWLFDKDFLARVGSRKEDYVDKKGEPDTLFYKLDYFIKRLSKWMLPEYRRASMILENLESGASISGESANPNFGRGGRKAVILFDELGVWDWARSSWESSGESTNFRIAMSTPPETGRSSYFHKLLLGEKGLVRRFDFDWKDVPSRDDNWFNNAKETKSEEEFAREVLKSYDGTVEGKVYAQDMRLVEIRDDIKYTGALPLFIAWDFGLDTVSMIWIQADLRNKKFYIIDYYENANKAIDFYIPFITGEIKSGIEKYDNYELNMILKHKLWARTITHFGDPSVKQHHLSSGLSTKEVLEDEFNIYIQSKDWSGRKWTDIRDITRLFFRNLIISEKTCELLISALRMARYPERREASQAISEPLKPIHDWTSHPRSALEFFCDNIYDEEKEENKYLTETNEDGITL